LPFDEAAAAIFDQLRTQKLRLGTNDLAIAAITLAVRGILVTRNTIDFPIGGFSPPEGRLARGFKPPAFSRFLFQSAVKSAESF
jgi:hypothetical protein